MMVPSEAYWDHSVLLTNKLLEPNQDFLAAPKYAMCKCMSSLFCNSILLNSKCSCKETLELNSKTQQKCNDISAV